LFSARLRLAGHKPKEKDNKMEELKQVTATLDQIKTGVETNVADIGRLQKEFDDMRRNVIKSRQTGVRAPGHVSEECAKFLAAVAIVGALKGGHMANMATSERERLETATKEIMAVTKTSISASDMPLPIAYGSEVVELVSQYGAARKYGTVYPLGTATTKLPRLKTDTAFGLLSIATAVTEKSPQFEFVTFTASKWGGMIRLPSEIEADSIVAVGQFLARYCARNIAKIEDIVYFIADGSGTYDLLEGLCKSTVTNSKMSQQASTKTKYSDATLANFRAIRAVVDAAIIGQGAYYMHPSFEQHLSGLNTAGDKPYNANGINGAALDGFPIRWVDVMPAYSTSANASKVFALFGDLSYQYLGVRGTPSIETSMHAGFTTDEILVRALERFTIGLMANGAVAGLQTAAS
jgi:HK97 family phage major capsid protein